MGDPEHLPQFFSSVLLIITNILLFNQIDWKILLPVNLAVKFFTIRWWTSYEDITPVSPQLVNISAA